MTTVQDILAFLNTIAPGYMKESWDNVGLNCGHRDKEVKTVLVALDPFAHVCREAVDAGADLLVTHHALLWNPGFITDETQQGANALYLMEHGIAHINAHTNLDLAPGGVNDTLAGVLGLSEVKVVSPVGTDASGREYGLLRQGMVETQPLERFLRHVKDTLCCEGLRYVDGGKPVHRVCVGGGACGSELMEAYRAGCDTFITADLKYNQFWDAQDLGINLIDAGHFHTENPICSVIAERIAEAFPEIRVILSTTHRDCVKFF